MSQSEVNADVMTGGTNSSSMPLLRQRRANGGGGDDEDDPTFISRHRQVLDRIQSDSAEARRYPVVPDFLENGKNVDAGGGTVSVDVAHHEAPEGWGVKAKKVARAYFESSGGDDWEDIPTDKDKDIDWLEIMLPMWKWLKVYKWRENISHDLVAGLTVGVMVIPQSMSYAKLAGLPVEYGLYSAFLPIYAYAFFGSSRQLAVGPVAIVSLLLSTGITKALSKMGYSEDDDVYQTKYNQLAVQSSFFVGIISMVMGLLRLGFVTIFLSRAVLSGFTTGAAIVIGLSQVKYILGTKAARSDRVQHVLHNLAITMDQFNWKVFLMGMSAIFFLLYLKWVSKTYPRFKYMKAIGPLLITIISIILVVAFNLDDKGIQVVGNIPSGLPPVTVDEWFPVEEWDTLFVLVISIVVVGFMESISIAKQLAAKHKYEISASSELFGLGAANLVGGVFHAYPVTGSFSRSAVNNETGARSGISGVVTATLVGFVLLLLTPVFENLPLCILGAVVISGVIGLLDYPEAFYLYKVNKFDFAVWMAAFLGTMFLGVEIGLAISVGVSMLIVIYESAYPHMAILGRLPGTAVYRNIEQYPDAERYDGIVMVRIDAPLYFANAQNVRDKVRNFRLEAEAVLRAREQEVGVEGGHYSGVTTVKYVIFEMSPVSHLDTSALHVLEDMVDNYKSRGQQICFSNPNLDVMQRMVVSGFADRLGRHFFFACLQDAVSWCLQEMEGEEVLLHESGHEKKIYGKLETSSAENSA